MRVKYINSFTDYGFKKLFGEEANKHLLIVFLNDILPIKEKIVKLKDQRNNVFYEKLNFVFIELPKFSKDEKELETHFDKWLYFLKHLDSFKSIPEILNEPIFIEAFKSAEIANFTEEEYEVYEESLKIMRDNINVINTAREEGKEEGKEETAENFLKLGINEETVAKGTGLALEKVLKIKSRMKK